MDLFVLFYALENLLKACAGYMHKLIFYLFLQVLHRLNVNQQPCYNSGDLERVNGSEVPKQDERYLVDC
jgi:hypothetical protein